MTVAVATAAVAYGPTVLLLGKTLNAFKEENLAHSFQTMHDIQPSAKIPRGDEVISFPYNERPLIKSFPFKGNEVQTEDFLNETKTSGLLVVHNDKIAYENYYLGADQSTRFAANSVTKSFMSALIGIAVEEGDIRSVEDSVADYVSEFQGTDMESITVKDALHMATGIDFDEEKDMGTISIKSMFGMNKMKAIAKYGLAHEPGTNRTYSSINTDILGEVLINATGKTLSEYMGEKVWSKLGVEYDAYWSRSGKKELANGGLHIALRDFARFGQLYLHNGKQGDTQLIPAEWVNDSVATDAPHLLAPHNGESDSELGYGYQWWIPEGNSGEFTAIGVFGQWVYVNPQKNIVIVKTSAHSGFEENDTEQKTIELFRAIADSL
ncbi:CubicO group peptidase (beta-lactamase class C family) [Arthrobacter sp. UYP6]|uniref:serine hydrolase domain-containing protein n=1 Tax=Arthrobacter sp. UYP6 TaxID=1756378 RepID=UPI003393D36E